MKSKKEYIILGVIIAALAAYLAVHKTDRTHYELPVISKLAGSDITSIKITKDLEIIELKQNDDHWLVYPEKYPADIDKIKPMIDVITELTVTALVSEAESYHRYELDSKNKISIQAGADRNILRTFDIGKSAPSNRHTFIKLPNDNRVYHARDNFRSKFDLTKDDLRDKTVLQVEQSQVHEIDIKDKDGNPVLRMKQVPATATVEAGAQVTSEEAQTPGKEKKNASRKNIAPENIVPELVWQDAEGNPVTEADINNLFNNVSALKCQSYITDKTKADFTDPMYILTMTGTKNYSLEIFEKINKDDDAYPAISSENDYPFMLPAYAMDNMVKK